MHSSNHDIAIPSSPPQVFGRLKKNKRFDVFVWFDLVVNVFQNFRLDSMFRTRSRVLFGVILCDTLLEHAKRTKYHEHTDGRLQSYEMDEGWLLKRAITVTCYVNNYESVLTGETDRQRWCRRLQTRDERGSVSQWQYISFGGNGERSSAIWWRLTKVTKRYTCSLRLETKWTGTNWEASLRAEAVTGRGERIVFAQMLHLPFLWAGHKDQTSTDGILDLRLCLCLIIL